MIELIESIWHEKDIGIKYEDVFNIITTLKQISNFIILEAEIKKKIVKMIITVCQILKIDQGKSNFFMMREYTKLLTNF